MPASATSKLTAEALSDLVTPQDVHLSPSAEHVVYTVSSDWNRPKGRWVSSLWVAEVGKPLSARQLTQGNSHDTGPQFSPDGNAIAFLSDRAKEGVTAIWLLDLRGGDAMPLTSTGFEKSIDKFAWSDDGRYIAYLSVDEKTAERKAKDERKDDAKVYGEDWEYSRLRTVEAVTKTVTTRVSENCHVYDFAWSPDSKSIAYLTRPTPEANHARSNATSIEAVGLDDHRVTKLADVPALLTDLCWTASDLWWKANYDITGIFSSTSVYKMSVATKAWSRHAFGENDCAPRWAIEPGLRRISEHSLVVHVQSGLADQLHVLPEKKLLYDKLQEVKCYDVALKDGKAVLALVTSSANTPNEIYSIVDGETVCLTDHAKEIAKMDIATSEPFYANAQDGTELDGVLVIPHNYDLPKPWPTIVLVHGGPYSRVSCAFDLPFFNWSPWFASAGYAVLCVNFRGGSSHGERYAAALRGSAGTVDYSDMIDLVKAGVANGIIDPTRVGIAGWSYGGYLAQLAVTRTSTFHFQAVISGAGITDWDTMIITAQPTPLDATHVAGHAPWDVGRDNTHNRKGSAIWHMQDVKTSVPVLILHGEDDPVVPVSQGRAFHQGCLSHGVPCELVVYPREGHFNTPPFERTHYIDMLERMKRFFGKHLARDVKV